MYTSNGIYITLNTYKPMEISVPGELPSGKLPPIKSPPG